MDARILARGLRARPTPWLLSSRQQQSIILNTLRYNSTTTSPQTPPSTAPSSEKTTQTTPAVSEDQTTPKPQPTKTVASDFDEILNKLDLGNRSTLNSKGEPRRVFADAVSRSVGGVGSQAFKERAAQQLASRKLELKLGPTLGRQIHVEPERGVDLPAAIRQLEITCSMNKIKANAHEQKFHKRKGAVRKELRRTRWRKLFRFSFQETVKKIQRMQAQGW
ncbi:uncharacterized protein N7496_008223 [Penicillium cataractarum]|uniref:Ribosomal protein S21 n=1 Tax=Penicillium cataractarum TaxID=2100454 RepID=A0A9W9RY01_9EURO|nr:uncharacterized protein N7496_008223 [Penicillium cataractarum]KAJ5368463.1 hypothetical protein N7496_008223 [Penicillium cataractarum]